MTAGGRRSRVDDGPSDEELTVRAQSGDSSALGLLLARYQGDMRAVALGVLGFGADADDAVQDACLIALRRLADVRDPAAIGPWLRTVTRNASRMRLRQARGELPLEDPESVPAGSPTPEQVVDGHALRDWIWAAMAELPEPLQLTLMLRYFSEAHSYEQIAAATGVPVGTVGSRLNEARAKMAGTLRAASELAHDDAAKLTAARHREGLETLDAAAHGRFADVVADHWSAGVELHGGMGEHGGRDLLLRSMDRDLEAGIRQRLLCTTASRAVTIWENELISPPDDPDHCPPAVTWILSEQGGEVTRLRLFFPVPVLTYLGRPVAA
jgi:RNA polymerase sigma factor (sigma-70 family)